MPGMTDSLHGVTEIGLLADDVRRELYLYISAQPEPVGRDQAAEALGLPRHQVKFQLDRLESGGLLVADYKRLSGRSGPGAGRPAKVYRRADRDISVSLPGRDYALAGELMAEAITRATRDREPIEDALAHVAAERGRELGERALGSGAPLEIAAEAMTRFGYEPRVEGDQMMLMNCPFHALAQKHTALVCQMNEALLGGMCERIGGLTSRLDPGDSRCCVVLSPVE